MPPSTPYCITGLSTKHQVLEPLGACYRVLRRSPRLRWLHTHSAGVGRPIYTELAARGVQVSTSAGANAQVVAQAALGAVLALSRRLPRLWAAQARREWAPLNQLQQWLQGPSTPTKHSGNARDR